MKKKTRQSAAHFCLSVEMQNVCNLEEMTTCNLKCDSINAPYRVRGIEMVIEVTFGETVEYPLQSFVMLHP